MEHSQIILNLLQEKNISAYKLSKKTGISESLFSKWKKNPTSDVSSSTLVNIAKALKCSVDSLVGNEEECERAEKFDPERLRIAMKDTNLEREVLEQRFGYKPKIIDDYLTGKRTPLKATLFQIATELRVNPEWLYGIEGAPQKKPTPEDGDGLDEQDRQLLELMKLLSADQKKFLLAQLLTLTGQGK